MGDRKGINMTDLLYFKDSYLRQFEAEVEAVEGQRVLLNQTAFYPGGGGQPADQGSLSQNGELWPVTKVKKQGAGVWHTLEGTPPGEGVQVVGELDWERRYQLMRTHTAMHILCGVIWRDYQVSVTGGNMDPLRGRMDFEFDSMSRELADEIEVKINQEVEAERAVTTDILPRDEAFQIPDLIRTKINLLPEGIKEVRIVEIKGLDLQADGGTHVANTREVGPLKVTDYKSKGANNKRIVVELEA
jgi:misacylated tRNA(Ala) deacylase